MFKFVGCQLFTLSTYEWKCNLGSTKDNNIFDFPCFHRCKIATISA